MQTRGPARAAGLGGKALRPLALGEVLVGVVAGADQGAGGDGLEAEVVGGSLEGGELVGVPVADDREVVLGRAQVLADGEDLDAACSRRRPKVSTISSKDSPRPTIRPDLVTTSGPPISLAIRRTRAERGNWEPRRAIG